MKRRSWVIAFVFGGLVGSVGAGGLLGTADSPVRKAFEEIQCDLNGDREPDFVRIYHSPVRNPQGGFTSIAVFLLRRQTYLVPIHTLTHSGGTNYMLWIKPVDLDDDGTSEFVVGKVYPGVEHSYTEVSVLDIAVSPEGRVSTAVRFSHQAEDLYKHRVRVEAMGPKGRYRLRLTDASFHLVNGFGVKKPKPDPKAPPVPPSPWLPMLVKPYRFAEQVPPDVKRIAGLKKAPEHIWLSNLDLNGDQREDAVLTVGTREGAGARAQLFVQTTYVLIGKRKPHVPFAFDEAELWFSLRTREYLGGTGADEMFCRQFSLFREDGVWRARIHETMYANLGGDAYTRGMHQEYSATRIANVADLVPQPTPTNR